MVAYCPTAISGGTCTDDECPNRHDIFRCEPCNCAFPAPLLEQHQTGKKHLCNVALNGHSNSGGLQQSPPSQLGLNAQLLPPPTPPPSSGGAPTPAADPRVIVSSEGGLDFATEGTGTPENLSFFADLTISITKTEVVSNLSVQSVVLEPLPNPYFSATLTGNTRDVGRKRPRSILVSFDAPRAGNFSASLKITFIDRLKDQEFTVTRELRGRAIHPWISVSPESGLEFLVECPRSDVPFAMQTMQLVISKPSPEPWVSFQAASLRPLDDPATSSFSARLEGDSKWIKHRRERTVTVSFTPQREGFCEAVLELNFFNTKHKVGFVIERTLRGVAKHPTGDLRHYQGSLPTGHRAHDNPTFSSDEGEELLDSDDTGISVSGENGLDFGIVERIYPKGPFATPTSSLTIKNAEGFPAVTLVEPRIRTLYGRDFSFVVTEGDNHPIQPGTESIVHIQFNPSFDGLFEATLELVFFDSERLARFVVSRGLHAIAGSLDDHKHFEFLDKGVPARRPEGGRRVPPQKGILLPLPGKSSKIPEYELPPSFQEIVDDATFNRHHDTKSRSLIEALSPRLKEALKDLKPPELNMDTYTQYFKALLNVEDCHQQLEFLDQRPYTVEVQQRGQWYSVEMEDKDEDHLPEAIIGDFLWLDDIQDDIRYEARITKVDLFTRSHISVLRISLRLPIDFNLYRGATFILRFRLNRMTLRRQYHALASSFKLPRRLLFPSVSDIKPIERHLSRAEIDNLELFNENVRDDDQQLQTVLSVLQQPKGSTPFIIFGPPGTGKTSTVVECIMQLVRRDPSVTVLACTPSNAAADLLVERLAVAGLNDTELFRLNAYSRSKGDIPKNIQTFSATPKHAKLLAYRVVLCTCSSAGLLQTLNVPAGHFSHIVIDEAAQAEEPLAMIPILSFSNASTNVILAGDPCQLGPVIKSPIAAKFGLRKSYLERLMRIEGVYGLDTRVGETIVDLQRNRRSHGAIIAWPNRWLYEDRMRASASADVTHLLLNSMVLPKKGFPVVFHGIKGGERRSKYSPSYFNICEAFKVRDYCKELTTDPERRIYPEDIGIVAPYRAQVRTIRKVLKLADLANIDVGSVEQFQGQERKVIILSTTRSNSAEEEPRLGFVQDRRRLNVAITRAQALLVVVGDPEVLGKDELWRTFLNYIILGGGQVGKGPTNWNPKNRVRVPRYSIIPREQPVYGEGFINGKSESIYRYHGE